MNEAVLSFSRLRATEIEKLVQISHSLDRPGIPGVFSFLIPVILDGIFHKITPQIFSPNVITMLQREDMTFGQVIELKEREHIVQYFILGSFFLMVILWIS